MEYALVFISDTHCGSTVGLAHPNGVRHDDGQMIMPSPLQLFLWEQYQQFCEDARGIIGDRPAHLFVCGDAVDGDHHRTSQIVSNDVGLHIQIAADVYMDGILRIDFETVHMLRGTPSHVGRSAGNEKSVAAKLANRLNREGDKRLVRDPRTNSFVWPFIYAEFNGTLVDVRHHGRAGQREHTRASYSRLYALDTYLTHHFEGRRPPDLMVRGHLHKYMDSGYDHRGITRAIQLPCFQLHTEWTRRISIESLPDIGGLVVIVREDGSLDVRPLLYRPEPDVQPIWRPN